MLAYSDHVHQARFEPRFGKALSTIGVFIGTTRCCSRIGSKLASKVLSLPVIPDPLSQFGHIFLQAKAHEINQVSVAEAAAILAKGQATAQVQGVQY